LNNDYANSNDSKKALVIAISDYDNPSGLKSIEFCKNDGKEMYDILKKNGYDIPDNHKLIGNVDSQRLKKVIYDFFTNEYNKPDDTLVFYYSGHGIPDKFGTTFLAPSDMDSDHPFITGFSFDDLTNSMLACNSLRIVTILDSCFSGSLKISKGLDSKSGEEAATRIANSMIEEKSEKLKQGVGRCLLAASQGYEEAYDRQEKDHSIFTYYLLEGLKGHKNAIDDEGNVTYDTLGKFITREIGNLPPEKRPKQTPVRKGEVSGGEIILANYPDLRKTKESDYYTLFGKGEIYYRRGKYQDALYCYNAILKNEANNEFALLQKGNILLILNEDTKAMECFDQVIRINNINSDAWYFKAQCYIKSLDYKNALESLKEASNINSSDERISETYNKIQVLMKTSTDLNNINDTTSIEQISELDSIKEQKTNTNTYDPLNLRGVTTSITTDYEKNNTFELKNLQNQNNDNFDFKSTPAKEDNYPERCLKYYNGPFIGRSCYIITTTKRIIVIKESQFKKLKEDIFKGNFEVLENIKNPLWRFNGFHVTKDEIAKIEFKKAGRIKSGHLVIFTKFKENKTKSGSYIDIIYFTDENAFNNLYSMMMEFLPQAVVIIDK
jgi:tetratricopeptide (TPR) repeat protein